MLLAVPIMVYGYHQTRRFTFDIPSAIWNFSYNTVILISYTIDIVTFNGDK